MDVPLSGLSVFRILPPQNKTNFAVYIRSIVNRYNLFKGKKGHVDHKYKKIDVKQVPPLPNGFRFMGFVSQRNIKHAMSHVFASLGAKTTIADYVSHAVVFLYNQSDIFALSSRSAWKVFYSHTDFNFIPRISARLLSPWKIYSEETPLSGAKTATSCTYRTKSHISETTLDSIFTITKKIKTHFKQPSSFYEILKLSNKVGAEIGVGQLRIKTRLTLKQYAEILATSHKVEVVLIFNDL